jgi:ligand-binding sensor domain-containing protein/DNA-binding CsgD family transcriptional regulator
VIKKVAILINSKSFKNFKKAKLCLFFILFLGISNFTFCQLNNQLGAPFIKNFTEEEIKNNLTIYDISQNTNGEMYFATPAGLLEYDGIRWKSYTYQLESDLRSVFYKDDQHIYTSGHGGFGYWSKNSKDILEYTSLFFKQPKKEAPLLPTFFRIKEIKGKILFQTFQQIYIYDPITNAIETIDAYRGFNVLFSSKGRAFIQDSELGLFEIKNKDRISIIGKLANQLHITGVFIQSPNTFLIVSKNKGIWTWEDGKLVKNDWAVNSLLEKYLVNDVQEFGSDQLIIGTVRNGVYIVSHQGEVLLHIEKSNGLIDNTVRRVFIDLNKNFWLGMDNGLSYLQTNSNTSYLMDIEGEFGTVFTSHVKDSMLYLGTNQGLFVKNIHDPKSKPVLVDNNLGQIWEIKEIDDQILVGSHEGVFVIEDQKLKTIHFEAGAWTFRKHPKIEDILYVGFYSGIGVFKRINGNWVFQKKWEKFGESSRFIEFDTYGQLWVAHPSKGYYRLILSDDGLDLKEFEFYGVNNNFVDVFAYLCKIDGDLIFYNPNGFFKYDPIENSFMKAKYSSGIFKGIGGINNIYQSENTFWYSTPKSVGYVTRSIANFNTISEPFYSIRNKHLNDFNKFKKLNDSTFGIGVRNGMVFHNIKKSETFNIPPSIRSIQLISTTDTILAPINSKDALEISYDNNFIKISLAVPKTPLANAKKIQYKLNGLQKDWSSWDYRTELNFPGLSHGSYVLEVRSEGKSKASSEIIKRAFRINPPWYLTNLAYGLYFLLLVLVNFIYRIYYKRNNEKQMTLLKVAEKEKRNRQEEKFQLDRLEAESKMSVLREDNLNLEIKKKNSELASSTLNNIKKNELLTSLVVDIEKINENVLNSSLHSPIKKLVKKINYHLIDKDDWLAFELHFRNAHAAFFDKLREKHPELSSNEIKLSAYLKLNLSSKEIASLMNISIKSVEQGRWRLRKKLNLPKESNLVNYIQSF